MLYLIEITKLNGKSLRNGWNAPRIGAKGLERTGKQEHTGRALCIKRYGKNGGAGAWGQAHSTSKILSLCI